METINDNKPAPPKRPLTAFFLFKRDIFVDIRQNNPVEDVIQLVKRVSAAWIKSDEPTKRKYEYMALEAKTLYQKDKQDYEKKYGKISKKKRKPKKSIASPQIINNRTNNEEEEENKKKLEIILKIREIFKKKIVPRKALTASFMFKEDVFEEISNNNPNKKVQELHQIIEDMWGHCDDASKAKYLQLSEDVQAAYVQVKKKYKSQYRKSKNREDFSKPAPPKRPLTVFFLFKTDVFRDIAMKNSHENLVQITQRIAAAWKESDEATKLQYEQKAKNAKMVYEKERIEYEAKYGKIENKKRKPINLGDSAGDDEDGSMDLKKPKN